MSRILAFFLAIAAIFTGIAPFPVLAAATPVETAGSPPPTDIESEPDLAGLIAAARAMRTSEALPGLVTGTAHDAAFGISIHVFDFDPSRFAMRVVEQKEATGSRASDFLDGPDDVFAINGGFFERADNGVLSPSGLLIVDGATVAAEHERAGSGIVYSDGKSVGIAYRKDLTDRAAIRQAIQVGPVLVDPGGVKGIHGNVPERHNRSAVCLRQNRLTFFAVEGGLSLFQFADLLSLPMSGGGFGCAIAINLDGGPSTQATLRAGSARLEIEGGTAVQNAIVVSRRDPP